MSVDCGDEYPDVVNDKTRRARVTHKCSACKETIERGHLYNYTAYLVEGEWDIIKRCMRCETIYQHLLDVCGDDTTVDARLDCGHSYADMHNDPCPPEIEALAFALPGEVQ